MHVNARVILCMPLCAVAEMSLFSCRLFSASPTAWQSWVICLTSPWSIAKFTSCQVGGVGRVMIAPWSKHSDLKSDLKINSAWRTFPLSCNLTLLPSAQIQEDLGHCLAQEAGPWPSLKGSPCSCRLALKSSPNSTAWDLLIPDCLHV